ncbi:MAG TPA: glutamate racemase [Spirochaetota bacterium]|nr:glutamate racemase [Spirochaetota bacterium]
MDQRAIGVFDSGVGGLTVAQSIIELLPDERIVYFGDTARVPYGSKSKNTIIRFAEENTHFLLSKDVKCIVVACNTATAIALPHLQEMFRIPIIGVVTPGAARAVGTTRNHRIGVIGTMRTVASGAYSQAITGMDPDAVVFARACPLFVPLIEEDWIGHAATRLVVREYLDELVSREIDTLVLGCTHYPLLADVIGACYPDLALVDSAVSTAETVRTILTESGMLAEKAEGERIHIWLSDYSESFHELAGRILHRDIDNVLFTVRLEELVQGMAGKL